MKQKIRVEKQREVLSLINNIAYTNVGAWYDSTRKNLCMDLIVPKNRKEHKRLPVVVWLCGGAFMVMDRAVWMPEMIRFARNGYVVAAVDYRTSNEVSFPEPLMDVKAAIRFLKAHAEEFCVDPEKIFIMGESAGGTIAGLVGTTGMDKSYERGDYLEYDSRVAGVVDFYGPASLANITQPAVGVLPYYWLDAFLEPGYSKEKAGEASIIEHVDGNTPPFMILHGENDTLVSVSQSDALYQKLVETGVDVEYLVLEGAEHGEDSFFQEEVIDRILAFLEKYV